MNLGRDESASYLNDCNYTNLSRLGSGDTEVIPNFLNNEEIENTYNELLHYNYQQWHHMPDKHNKTLPLSRLKVAMTEVSDDGWIPHYRFPVNNQDQHGIRPFTKQVKYLLNKVIQYTGIQFNHSVVLLYR